MTPPRITATSPGTASPTTAAVSPPEESKSAGRVRPLAAAGALPGQARIYESGEVRGAPAAHCDREAEWRGPRARRDDLSQSAAAMTAHRLLAGLGGPLLFLCAGYGVLAILG